MTLSSRKPIVGFIGLGVMGAPMAANVAKAGFPLVVWNRTAAKMNPLLQKGAKKGASPAHVASEADIVITMVSKPADVEEIVLKEEGVFEGLKPGAVLVDMSTVTPNTSRKLAAALTTKHAEFLDAPVVGSKCPATEGTLVILVGGLPTTLERCRAVLSAMGKTIIHAGSVGAGTALKLATNLMLAHLAAGFAEGLLLAERAGLDPKRYFEVLEASTFRSPWYQTKGATMVKRDFSTHFALKHMLKDLQLMTGLAGELQLGLPVTHAIERLFTETEASGKGELDYSSILTQLDNASS